MAKYTHIALKEETHKLFRKTWLHIQQKDLDRKVTADTVVFELCNYFLNKQVYGGENNGYEHEGGTS